MPSQTTSEILMIRPVRFGFNNETAVNNAFQNADPNQELVNHLAQNEFDKFVTKLRDAGVNVWVINDTPETFTPDSIFPNNWISFHENGTIVLYPMFAPNRRNERKSNIIEEVKNNFHCNNTLDFSAYENDSIFLEGTGSMVLDRENRLAYGCISPRTDKELMEKWCMDMDFEPVIFKSRDENGMDIYHTNVMMAIADQYVVICLDTITDDNEKKYVIQKIKDSGKSIIEITCHQMNHFAGNMLQVENNNGEKILVMSTQAWESLNQVQKINLKEYNQIVHSDIKTIETNGGGSARCMMAEIHLKKIEYS